MSDAMLDARQEGGSYRRIEVITGQRRRRRWTAQEKARIVAESFAAGVSALGFVPVQIACESSRGTADEPSCVAAAANRGLEETALPAGQLRGGVEIEVSGARIRVEPGVDPTTLSTVLS